MEFLARHCENILLDYRFIRAIGVQLNLKSDESNTQGVHLKYIATLSMKFNRKSVLNRDNEYITS